MVNPCDGDMVLYSCENTICTNPINPPRHLVHDEDPGGVPDEVPPGVVAEEGLEDRGGAGRRPAVPGVELDVSTGEGGV